METYLPFCEQYAAMAQCFYSQYQQSAAGNDVICKFRPNGVAIPK